MNANTNQRRSMNMKNYIDINCDVGEGMGNEADLFPFISSCNVACGGHAGDEAMMRWIVSLARKHHVKIGAHPSYPDFPNFGRVSIDISPKELSETIQCQVAQLGLVCDQENASMHHIKAHGALYNDCAKGGTIATVFLEALEHYKTNLFLYVPAASTLEQMALTRGFKIKREAFGDRNYNQDLSLVSRKEINAVISEPNLVFEQLVRLVLNHRIATDAGTLEELIADTYCIHGDTPNALQILMYLSKQLPKNHIYLQK